MAHRGVSAPNPAGVVDAPIASPFHSDAALLSMRDLACTVGLMLSLYLRHSRGAPEATALVAESKLLHTRFSMNL